MTQHIVAHVPIAEHGVAYRVEARHVIVAHEPHPCLVRRVREQDAKLAYHQCLKPYYNKDNGGSDGTLLFLYNKQICHFLTLLLIFMMFNPHNNPQ